MLAVAVAVASVFYYICLRDCARLKPSGKSPAWLWGSLVLLVGPIAALNLMNYYGIAIMPIVWVLLTVAMRLSTGMTTWQAVCVSGMVTTFAYGMRGIVSSILAIALYLFKPELMGYVLEDSVRAVVVYGATLLLLAVLRAKLFSDEKISKFLHNKPALVTIVIYECSVCVNLQVLIQGEWAAASILWYFGIILGGSLLAVGMLIYLTYYVIDSSQLASYRLYSSMLEEQYAQQLRHYATYERYIGRLREFKHDHMALLASVAQLVKEQQPEKALMLIEDMAQSMSAESAGFKRYTTNVVFDATIQNLAEFCEEEGIRLKLDIASPDGLPLEQMDEIRVLYNVLKNAAEACLRLPRDKRWISLISHVENGWYYLEVQNSLNGSVYTVDNTLVTTKDDAENHGLGVKIVRETVEKAGGLVTFAANEKDETFALQVMVPIFAQGEKAKPPNSASPTTEHKPAE